MPGQNEATEMQQKKSRVENILKQDTRMVQDVTKLDQRLNREYYSVESTRSDVQLIDEMLKALPFPEVSEEEKGTQSDIRAQIGQKMKAFLEVEEIQKLKSFSDGKTVVIFQVQSAVSYSLRLTRLCQCCIMLRKAVNC